jgi:hypothetical protein
MSSSDKLAGLDLSRCLLTVAIRSTITSQSSPFRSIRASRAQQAEKVLATPKRLAQHAGERGVGDHALGPLQRFLFARRPAAISRYEGSNSTRTGVEPAAGHLRPSDEP